MKAWLLALLLMLAPSAARAESFDNWAVAVVAGDFHAHSGHPTQAFDNARRDVVASLLKAGVRPGNLLQFSAIARVSGDTSALQSDRQTFDPAWYSLTRRTTGGCLVYLTSHGNPDGVLVGAAMMSPIDLDLLLDVTCAARPTVVVISACYSGVFVPVLAAPNRFVMTAARRDRSSFGCSEDATYPYFDGCVLKSMPAAKDFPGLAAAAKSCIAAREKAEKLTPPSEPQTSLGSDIAPLLAHLPLHPATTLKP